MSVAPDSISLCRSSELAPGHSPAAVLADAVAAVRGLAETLWSARSDDELVEVVGRVQQLTSALAAVEAGAVAEADARDLAKEQLQYGSTGDWLTHTGGLHRGERQTPGGPGAGVDRPAGPNHAGTLVTGRCHRSRPT